MPVVIPSPAKINLFLEVLGKRLDGYHEIVTVFQSVELSDFITLRPRARGVVFSSNVDELETEDNLCVRAARLLQMVTGERRGVAIHLEKHIPWGAGFGGGSSNAAATLIGLRDLYQLDISNDHLLMLARQLGADVPFFLRQGCALGRGIGDELTPVPLRHEFPVVLVKPAVSINTAMVYAELDSMWDRQTDNVRSPDRLVKGLVEGSFDEICAGVFNRFEKLVLGSYPEVAMAKEALEKTEAGVVLLSGTGSGLFGLYSDPAAAGEAASRLRNMPGVQVFLSRMIRGIVMGQNSGVERTSR
jgi:4-diphosphocytidyl-2-C-methyl-D-erythritol kinase